MSIPGVFAPGETEMPPLTIVMLPEPAVFRVSVPIAEWVLTVTAPPPAHVHLQTTSIAAGVGVSWGDGTLSFEGERYPFSVKGLSVGDI